MDDDVATATTGAPAATRNTSGLLLLLSLSLSPENKAIAKGRINKHRHRARADDDGAFRCRTCGRHFATLQALGGHRTRHNKRPRVHADGLDLLLDRRGRIREPQ